MCSRGTARVRAATYVPGHQTRVQEKEAYRLPPILPLDPGTGGNVPAYVRAILMSSVHMTTSVCLTPIESPADPLGVEQLPLALCCDDPSAVRWRIIRAGQRRWPLYWGPVLENATAGWGPAGDGKQPVAPASS